MEKLLGGIEKVFDDAYKEIKYTIKEDYLMEKEGKRLYCIHYHLQAEASYCRARRKKE